MLISHDVPDVHADDKPRSSASQNGACFDQHRDEATIDGLRPLRRR